MANYDLDCEFPFAQNQLKAQMEFSMAINQRKIFINENITEDSVFKYMYYLNKIVYMDKDCDTKKPIELCINTNGGSVYDCFTLISYLEQLKDEGYNIITTNIGRAFSAGFLISIVGTERRAYRYARYMYHEISSGIYGKYHTMQEDLIECKILLNTAMDLIKKYTDINIKDLERINECKIDKFYSAEELKELKGVDIIL